MKRILLILAGILTAMPAPGLSQEIGGAEPGAIRERAAEMFRDFRIEKKEEKDVKAQIEKEGMEETLREPEAPEAEQQVAIRQIVTDASEILTDDEIRGVVAPYENRTMPVRDLFEVVSKLNELYASKNFLTARAILPAQEVKEGVVHIRLVEARVGGIQVDPADHTRDGYVRRQISLRESELVRLDVLERDIRTFNWIHDARMRAALRAGESFGTTDILIHVDEPPNYGVTLFADNAGQETVGEERIGLALLDRSVLGYRDVLALAGYWADGTLAGSASYSLPLYFRGTRLQLVYDYNAIEIQSGPFKDLNIEGDSWHADATLKQFLYGTPTYRFEGALGYHTKESKTEISGVELSKTEVRTLELGIDYLSLGPSVVWSVEHIWTSDVGGDENFYRYNGFVMRQQRLLESLLWTVRASGQISDTDLLPPSEQFQLGGIATVRGFEEGVVLGDQGYFLSTEVLVPVSYLDEALRRMSPLASLKFLAFVDYGAAYTDAAGDDVDNHLLSAGGGFTFEFTQYLMGRVLLGVPLDDTLDNRDDMRIHFALQSQLY